MSYTITQDCIGCNRCLSACPTGAIETDGDQFRINVNRCNQCEGSYGVPQCWSVCPTNSACVPLKTVPAQQTIQLHQYPDSLPETGPNADYWDTWFAAYDQLIARLKQAQPSDYWQCWFDNYSQNLRSLSAQT